LGESWWNLKAGSTFKHGLPWPQADEQGFICNQGVASSILASSTSACKNKKELGTIIGPGLFAFGGITDQLLRLQNLPTRRDAIYGPAHG